MVYTFWADFRAIPLAILASLVVAFIVPGTCQVEPDSLSEDYPLCAEVRVSRNDEAGTLLVQESLRDQRFGANSG